MLPIFTDQVVRSVSRFVCQSVSLSQFCKNSWTDQDAIWVMGSDGPKESCIRWGSSSPMGRGNFEGEGHARACPMTLLWAMQEWLNYAIWVVWGGDVAFLSNYLDHLLL